MKFNCGLTAEERTEWHPYFAWLPVRVGYKDCRWLEYVERRYDDWVDEHRGVCARYRALTKEEKNSNGS